MNSPHESTFEIYFPRSWDWDTRGCHIAYMRPFLRQYFLGWLVAPEGNIKYIFLVS